LLLTSCSDKNNATTFQLLYRSQDDPLLHDDGDRALYPIPGPAARPGAGSSSSGQSTQSAKALHIADLEDELDFDSMRDNEGEAAEHGIYYDDTSYDYMQHLRDIGQAVGESHFLDAAPVKVKGKGKAKTMKLEDALRESTLEDDEEYQDSGVSAMGDDLSTFSRSTRPRTYQDQQDVPDDIAGFQPDMDPRLREVLEALDDEAYVDDKDEEDMFGELTQGGSGQELDLDEFENILDDEGWESDATERPPPVQQREVTLQPGSDINTDEVSTQEADVPSTQDETSMRVTEAGPTTEAAVASAEDGDWLRDFAKFKRDAVVAKSQARAEARAAASAANGPASALYTVNGTPLRRKRRKGALTNPSAYSMTSSSLTRTEGQQLLDARFEKVEAMYALGEDDEEFDDQDGGMSLTSGLSRQSKMSTVSTKSFADGDVREDLDSMMDGFLADWNKSNPGGGGGKRRGAKGKRGKNGNEVVGIKMLDEIRGQLGPARVARTKV
jgi:protein LTV1